ncbi:MAG TPA: murein L,D-transpeptidase family protein [Rhodoblastus sp.]|nr:murein L,D-transpeptidase family protein [Rhodoblastus sp.]
MKQRRAVFMVAGLVAICVAAGAALAHLAPWEAGRAAVAVEPQIAAPTPAETRAPEPAPMQLASLGPPIFAPALRLRSYLPASPPPAAFVAPAETPVVETPAVEAALPTADVGTLLSAPLPPVRPRELSALLDPPLPPVRPGDLDGQAAGQAGGQASGQASGQVVVASLAPAAVAPAPETKPPLVEPQPTPAPAPTIVEKPPVANVPFAKGQQAFVRIFKKEGELELWLRKGDHFALYKTYPVCKWSGHLGPKMREGDYQSPEGFYSVSARQLHPKSKYYRAFNVGFPNALDKQLGYTGGALMVHGDCQSVGCFAMTDRGIDEIYNYVAAAIASGQKEVPVHIFPFRMTDTQLARETGTGLLAFASSGQEQYASFWRNMKEGYDFFEKTGEPPVAYACNGRYAFNASAACKRIAGW